MLNSSQMEQTALNLQKPLLVPHLLILPLLLNLLLLKNQQIGYLVLHLLHQIPILILLRTLLLLQIHHLKPNQLPLKEWPPYLEHQNLKRLPKLIKKQIVQWVPS